MSLWILPSYNAKLQFGSGELFSLLLTVRVTEERKGPALLQRATRNTRKLRSSSRRRVTGLFFPL